jgi:hypothetical protein
MKIVVALEDGRIAVCEVITLLSPAEADQLGDSLKRVVRPQAEEPEEE